MNPEISDRDTFGYCPTPEQIAEATAAIRENWSDTRWRHQHGAPKPVDVEVRTLGQGRRVERREYSGH